MKPGEYPPITNEKLKELDSWYEQFTSNSFEMKFCDADYWAMRQRLKMAEALIDAIRPFLRRQGTDAKGYYDWDVQIIVDSLAEYDAVVSPAQSGDTTSDSTQSLAAPGDSAPSARDES